MGLAHTRELLIQRRKVNITKSIWYDLILSICHFVIHSTSLLIQSKR